MAKSSGVKRAPSVAQLAAQLHQLLEPLTREDRARVVQAAFILVGDVVPTVGAQPSHPGAPSGLGTNQVQASRASASERIGTAAEFFANKSPQNKGEELAVACRFRELTQQGDVHSKKELQAVYAAARKNFDANNFARDVDNAKRQSGFFVSGTKRDKNQLSYYGQQFVDALPDRQAAAAIRKPVTKKTKKRKKKTVK